MKNVKNKSICDDGKVADEKAADDSLTSRGLKMMLMIIMIIVAVSCTKPFVILGVDTV